MRPSLATDRISLSFWLNISFVVNYRAAIRSIVAIAIDLSASEYQYLLWITAVPLPRRCLQSQQACFLPKGSYAYPSSVIILWSEICIQNFLCVWVNGTSEHTSWEKSTALKDRDQTEMIGFDCICLYRTRHVLHGISSVLKADRSLHGARNRLLYDLNNWMVEGVDCPVLAGS